MQIKQLELQMSRQKEVSTSREVEPTLKTREPDGGAPKQKRGLFDWFRPRRDNVQEARQFKEKNYSFTWIRSQ